jgi:hypothetical protein
MQVGQPLSRVECLKKDTAQQYNWSALETGDSLRQSREVNAVRMLVPYFA